MSLLRITSSKGYNKASKVTWCLFFNLTRISFWEIGTISTYSGFGGGGTASKIDFPYPIYGLAKHSIPYI